MGNIPFALALYTVRDHIEKDIAYTLKRVKEIGYDYVELAFMDGPDPEYKTLLSEAGLEAVSALIMFDEITKNTEAVIESTSVLGVQYVVMPWLGPPSIQDKADWLRCAEALDQAGAKFRAAGIQLGYHNHNHEFEELDGQCILDIIMGSTQPENLFLELDTYWAKHAGVDPVTVIEKYAERCQLLHIKDMTGDDPPTFAEVGRGIMDWPPIFAAGAAAGTKWYIVEQDESSGDSLESAAISAEFMAKQ